MSKRAAKQITLSRNTLLAALLLALLLGGAGVYFALIQVTVKPATQSVSQAAPDLKSTPIEKLDLPVKQDVALQATSVPAVNKQTEEKPKKVKVQAVKHNNEFVLEGLLSTAGEPWAARMILVKVLWLKNKDQQQFLLGKETAVVQATEKGFAYRITLRPQAQAFVNWNGGVEGNVGRVIAFLDHKRDGRLTLQQDKIIAVSKELLRYRTGRFDKKILNDIQQHNIKQAGKGYVIVRNVQLDDNKADWQVVARQSPARLDLSAAETSLPDMYNTFMKLQ